MRLSTCLLLPAVSVALASLNAQVYIFEGEDLPSTSTPPTLSPEEARLVFAQRLGVSKYHGIGDASETTLSYISQFGGPQEELFEGLAQDKAAELILIVEGLSTKTAKPLLNSWPSMMPTFFISDPPSTSSNLVLARELQAQVGAGHPQCLFEDTINPFEKKCWSGKSKIMHIDLSPGKVPGIDDLMAAQERLMNFVKRQEMNVVIVLMPEASRGLRSAPKPYGSYEMPNRAQLGRRQEEEPITEEGETSPSVPISQGNQVHASNSTEPEPLLPVPGACYASLDACNSWTNSCSGHGQCYQKTGKDNGRPPCFACMCTPTEDHFLQGDDKIPSYRIIYWGGAACQKKDVSGPFWLFATFTVVMIGLISWAIGMLFSIGEEKLPGVIGAGVSSKAR